ncbi:hypothetical protein IP84_07685 [beta proteobacterium AAP99]|nr:hypothetical protein IP84_07685 [beta proteobacterium AAP99]
MISPRWVARAALLIGALGALLAGCQRQADDVFYGYVEGEYTRVASPVAGRLTLLAVKRGAQLPAGAALFALDSDVEAAQVSAAEADLRRAQAQLANLKTGRRPEEIAQLQAELAAAANDLSTAQIELKRQEALVTQGFSSPAVLDTTRNAVARAQARRNEAAEALKLGAQGARRDEVLAQGAAVSAAEAAVTQARWRLAQKTVTAPVPGRVADTLYTPGEQIAANSPVVSLLAPGNLRLRFYVPAGVASQLKPGVAVQAGCEGCTAAISARVQWIATEPEYTPPVIYSREQRSKLVFLVQASVDEAAAARLNPGMPVDVRVPPAKP